MVGNFVVLMDNAITSHMPIKVIQIIILFNYILFFLILIIKAVYILYIDYTVYFILVPHIARTKTWKSCEANEIIFVWYHAEGLEPNWQPQTISHVLNRTWRYHGRNEFLINCHIQVRF